VPFVRPVIVREWAVPPVVVNVSGSAPYAVPATVPVRQVAFSSVVTWRLTCVVPAGWAPVGAPPLRTGGVVSAGGDPPTGVAASTWMAEALSAPA
jgi:hypothetical protein